MGRRSIRPEHQNRVWSHDFVSARMRCGRSSVGLLTLVHAHTRESLHLDVRRHKLLRMDRHALPQDARDLLRSKTITFPPDIICGI